MKENEMTGPRWNQTIVSNHRSYKNAKAKMDKLNASAPEGTVYELMPLNNRVTFRAVSNPMEWRLIRKVYPQAATTTVDATPAAAIPAEADTSGYGEGFCRCGRVFMWGECAGGHQKKSDPTPTTTPLQTFDLTTEVQSADGQQWQAINMETIEARDIDHAASLVGEPCELDEPGTAWRVTVSVRDDFAVTPTRVVDGVVSAAADS